MIGKRAEHITQEPTVTITGTQVEEVIRTLKNKLKNGKEQYKQRTVKMRKSTI